MDRLTFRASFYSAKDDFVVDLLTVADYLQFKRLFRLLERTLNFRIARLRAIDGLNSQLDPLG